MIKEGNVELKWFGAEGEQDGHPLIIRGRKFSDIALRSELFPDLLVVRMTYKIKSANLLPDPEQHSSISDFEVATLDKLEANELGLVSIILTSLGSVKYYIYVKDVECTVALFNSNEVKGFQLEFQELQDPQWLKYKKLIAQCLE